MERNQNFLQAIKNWPADSFPIYCANTGEGLECAPSPVGGKNLMPDRTTNVRIHYCTQCQWQLRAVWMAQEILASFSDDIYQMILQPGTGGVFEIWVNETCIWERKKDGGFPSAKELKLRVRNCAFPEKPLGSHIEKSAEPSQDV